MEIKHYFDEGLAHSSYSILSGNEVILIDPARDSEPYQKYASDKNAKITKVIETHPHADFISSHKELAKDGAKIYVSKLYGAEYPHETFDDGDKITLESGTLEAINTPGHSPDSISILAKDKEGNQLAVFTGDTLFIGDVGRPDLRENVGNIKEQRESLAKKMYSSLREKLMVLDPSIMVYPAHGSGSLCGKALSDKHYSTLAEQLETNYALQDMSQNEFVGKLLEDQPYIPKYFGYDVDLNKKGAPDFPETLHKVEYIDSEKDFDKEAVIIDSRDAARFAAVHIEGSINLQDGDKFETWLGSIVSPSEKISLIAESKEKAETLLNKASKIGYELLIDKVLITDAIGDKEMQKFDYSKFKENKDSFTIVDVRNSGEVSNGKYFEEAINIPLPELRERASEIPTGKPVVVHCAAGYRSAAAASILNDKLTAPVYDMSTRIEDWK
jgi:glyoxylase-like metal-dependent hydrolase (beta-lactamase superfamily II)/rhodanese-related sulfurtransferase